MTKIAPLEYAVQCRACGESFSCDEFHFTGMHILASGKCRSCQERLFHEMPTGAGLLYPTVVNSRGERVDDLPFSNWFTHSLQVCVKTKNDSIIIKKKITGRIRDDKRDLLLLNAIDQTYGHCIFTLCNAQAYINHEKFYLLVVVQKEFEWMLPEGIDEVWVVDIPFSNANAWHTNLEFEVQNKIRAFPGAFLARALPNAPEGVFNIQEFTKVAPFPLNEWNKRLKERPTITFIWRTDRFWKKVLPRWVDNSISRRFFPNILKRQRSRLQFNWLLKFSKTLREQIPHIDFAVAGMDNRDYPLPSWVKDFRFPKHKDEWATLSCQRYAESHLIVGCNGSSLVLPSFHAGAVLNIVPVDGLAVSVGSFYFRQTTVADMLMRYVMLNSEVSIDRIVKTCVQILRDRSMAEIISGKPWNDALSTNPSDNWRKFRQEIFDNTSYFKQTEGLITKRNETV